MTAHRSILAVAAVMAIGTLAGCSTSQPACEAKKTFDTSIAQLHSLDLDDASGAPLRGAVTSLGSSVRSLAIATKTSDTSEYTTLRADIDGFGEALGPADEGEEGLTGHRQLVEQALAAIATNADTFVASLNLSC